MKIKNSRKGKLALASVTLAGLVYLLSRNAYVPSTEKNVWNAFFVKDKTEKMAEASSPITKITLENYNQYLKNHLGSEEQLTEKDLEIIASKKEMEADIIAVQIDEFAFNQIGMEDYLICETEDGIECFFPGSSLNLFANLYEQEKGLEKERRVIATVGEFIKENDIESIGYTTCYPGWNDKEFAFVRENYGEDILDCLRAKGFPIVVYDVQDFYKAYEENYGVTR